MTDREGTTSDLEDTESMPTVAMGHEDAPDRQSSSLAAWSWVPTLYFAEAIPYVLVASVSTVLFKDLAIPNDKMAAATSLLYLPWVVKPLWSPLIDVLARKRSWIIATQVLLALAVSGIGWALTTSYFWTASLAAMWVVAIASATHDIAADGFYLIGLRPNLQAIFVGIRSAFYRLGWITTQGLLVVLAGRLAASGFEKSDAWSLSFYFAGACLLSLAIYHAFVLPRCESNPTWIGIGDIATELGDTFVSFFAKPGIVRGLLYLLLYRFSEAQLGKLAQPFLLDKTAEGGLGLSVERVGIIYGTFGVAMLVAGGILGGLAIARYGLGRWLLPMAIAMNLPNLAYLYLAHFLPSNWFLVSLAVGIEQFGYGFGFAGYMVFMLYLAQGQHKTAHFALCTGIMALGMMLPGYFSGSIQQALGYKWFFVYVLIATIPSFVVTGLVRVDRNFGREQSA